MAEAAWGQLSSWEDAIGGKSNDFFSMRSDDNYEMRFLNPIPSEYLVHWVETGPNKMVKVKCAARGCILCAKGLKPKVTFVSNILDRKSGRCYIFEFGRQIFDQLKGYALSPKWGSLLKYDIVINKKKDRKPNVYMVQANPPISQLSESEIAMAKEFMADRGDLKKLAAPTTNEDIKKRLADFLGADDVATTKTAFASNSDPATNLSDDNMDFSFPDFK